MNIRYIPYSEYNADFNMAADGFFYKKAADTPNTIYIRFYGWNPSAITLGYMQKAQETLNQDACINANVQWIGRPTGGRAVLHANDITYSVCFSTRAKALGSTIAATYALISDALIHGLSLVNIHCGQYDADLDTTLVRGNQKLPCFLAPSRREIMVHGKKLVGSAQKRSTHAVLQHGSIPLTNDFRRLPDFQNISPQEAAQQKSLLEQKCTCIAELNNTLTISAIVHALMQGFDTVLGEKGKIAPLSDEEIDSIMQTGMHVG